MREQIQKLWELQELEKNQKDSDRKRASVNSGEVHSVWVEVQQLSRRLEAERQRLEMINQLCRDKEQQLNGLLSQRTALEKRLYGGEVAHTKEMEQLRDKCELLRHDEELQEQAILDLMEQGEELACLLKQGESELKEKKQRHSRKQQELSVLTRQADEEAERAAQACQAITSSIDTQLLSIYQQLKSKVANPVAKMENGICYGCRMSVPTGQSQGSGRISYCDNCGRIVLQ